MTGCNMNTISKKLTTQNILFTWALMILLYHVYWFVVPTVKLPPDFDSFLYFITMKKMQNGLIPSVDFYAPLGYLNFQLFNIAYKINPAGAFVIAKLPFTILFVYTLYAIRNQYDKYIIVIMITLFTMFGWHNVLYDDFTIGYGLTKLVNIYNEILLIVYFTCITLIMQNKSTYTQYAILAILSITTFLIKANGSAIVLAFLGLTFLFDKNRIKHGLFTLVLYIIIFLTFKDFFIQYIPAYLQDLNIAKQVKDPSVEKGIISLIIGYIIWGIVLKLLYQDIKPFFTFKNFITISVIGGTLFMFKEGALHIFVFKYVILPVFFILFCFITTKKTHILRKNSEKNIIKLFLIFVLYIFSPSIYATATNLYTTATMSKKNAQYLIDVKMKGYIFHTESNSDDLHNIYNMLQTRKDMGMCTSNSKTLVLHMVNLADIWCNEIPGTYPAFLNILVEYNATSHPDPKEIFSGYDYIITICPTSNVACHQIHHQLWSVYGDYISANYTVIHTYDGYTVWRKNE